MVIDTSAVIAILLAEDDAERYTRAIAMAAQCLSHQGETSGTTLRST